MLKKRVDVSSLLGEIIMRKMQQKLELPNGSILKNRLVMAPMTNKMSFYDGVVTSDELCYYAFRTGDVGMMITAAAYVKREGKGWDGQLGASDDKHLLGLSKLAATMKQSGTKAILQLFHAGRRTNSKILHGIQPVSASAVASLEADAEIPQQVSTNEIEHLIEAFARATKRAIQAGFDGVEIHGANGYLLQQFYSPHANVRDDEWGGNRENRYRFIKMLVERVCETAKAESEQPFIVGYRFSPEEGQHPGITLDDTLYLVEQLLQQPVDYLHVSLAEFQSKASSSVNHQEKMIGAYLQEIVAERVPLIGVGGVKTMRDVETALETFDCIAIGRALLIDPRWAEKILADQEAMIRRELILIDRPVNYISNGALDFLTNRMA